MSDISYEGYEGIDPAVMCGLERLYGRYCEVTNEKVMPFDDFVDQTLLRGMVEYAGDLEAEMKLAGVTRTPFNKKDYQAHCDELCAIGSDYSKIHDYLKRFAKTFKE